MRSSSVKSYALTLGLALGCAACDRAERESTALAVACMRAADDNRVKLSASWLSGAEVEVEGDRVTVHTEVPVGVGIDGKVRFRYYEYRCRIRDGALEFVGYEVS